MAREKISLSARIGAVMGVERAVKDKLVIDAKVSTWNDLSVNERSKLFKEALKESTRNKKRLQ
jgi:hypothetical protein